MIIVILYLRHKNLNYSFGYQYIVPTGTEFAPELRLKLFLLVRRTTKDLMKL